MATISECRYRWLRLPATTLMENPRNLKGLLGVLSRQLLKLIFAEAGSIHGLSGYGMAACGAKKTFGPHDDLSPALI